MKKIGMVEGKARFSAIIADALKGETTIITRKGRPVAEIRPLTNADANLRKRAVQRLESRRSRLASEGRLKDLDNRSLIDEDRAAK
jgi:antitoxin (DNA-binding transcriptional repressor) of toxin-antitoxin stability system